MSIDTTPGVDHAAAIRDRADRLYHVSAIGIDVRDNLIAHADALDAARRDAEARADAAEERVARHKRLEMILGADMPSETLAFMIDLADDIDAEPAPARADGGA